MCGIVGYIGKKEALPVLIQGLRDLEYRGYDSAGVAVREGKLALVHNGIIENYRELKKELKNQNLESETDSEILARLIFENYDGDLLQAVKKVLPRVRGMYGLLVMHADHPGELVAARLGSPLVVGLSDGEYYIASDVTPMLPFTKQVTFLDDGEVADISLSGLKIFNLKDELIQKGITQIDWDIEKAQKGGFENFMLKEIFDQPTVFGDAIRGRLDMKDGTAKLGGLNLTLEEMQKIKRIVLIACGTAYHACLAGKYAFERLAGIPTEVDVSSEFRYRDPIIDERTLVFGVSQSGETIDTIMALSEAKRKGGITRGIVNVIGSTIAREAGAGTYIHAGPELAVASTTAYM